MSITFSGFVGVLAGTVLAVLAVGPGGVPLGVAVLVGYGLGVLAERLNAMDRKL